MRRIVAGLACAVVWTAPAAAEDGPLPDGFKTIETIVVVYPENRSFVHLLPDFPGAFGDRRRAGIGGRAAGPRRLGAAVPAAGLATIRRPDPGRSNREPDPAYPASMPNAAVHDRRAAVRQAGRRADRRTRSIAFYQNQMQINGGRNDMFVAWTNVGSLTMGTYRGEGTHLYAAGAATTRSPITSSWARSAAPTSTISTSPAPARRASRTRRKACGRCSTTDGNLKLAPDSPKSALDGPPKWVQDGSVVAGRLCSQHRAARPTSRARSRRPMAATRASPTRAGTRCRRRPVPTLGDRLSDKGVDWAWYAQGWDVALAYRGAIYNNLGAVNFQPHHQPYNYFANYAPGTEARKQHLKDMEDFWDAAAAGTLPAVAFVKPDGNDNQHPGESTSRRRRPYHGHASSTRCGESPQWDHMAIIITHDENGGFWDPVPPPKGDRWGPGSRVPTVIVSPFAKKGLRRPHRLRHHLDPRLHLEAFRPRHAAGNPHAIRRPAQRLRRRPRVTTAGGGRAVCVTFGSRLCP